MVIARIIDGDEASLAQRVSRLTAEIAQHVSVSHFTYWFTNRPPTFEAVVTTTPRPRDGL